MHASESGRQSRWPAPPLLFGLILLLALGLWLRWRYMQQISLHVDEFTTLWAATRVQDLGLPLMPSGVLYTRGLLASYVEALFLSLFGFSYTVGRLPGLLFGLATVVALFAAGRREWGARVGLLAAAGLVLLPEAIVWGGRARFYTQLQFFVLLAVWAAYAAVARDSSSERTQKRSLWLFALLFSLAVYSQEETVLLYPSLLIGMLIWSGWRALRRPTFLIVQAICVLAMGSRYALEIWGQPGYFETIQSTRPYVGFVFDLVGAWATYGPLLAAPDRIVWTLGALLAVVAALIGLRRTGFSLSQLKPTHQATLFFALQLAALLFVLLFLVGSTWREARYLFLVQPFWLLCGAAGLIWLTERVFRGERSRWIVTTALVALLGLVFAPSVQRILAGQAEGYDLALAYLDEVRESGEPVLSPQPPACALVLGPCDYYALERGYEEFVILRDGELVDRWSGATLLSSADQLETVLRSAPRAWLVSDSFRLATRYGPEYVRTIVEQFELVFEDRGVMVLRSDGWQEPVPMMGKRMEPAVTFGALDLSGWEVGPAEPGAALPVALFWRSSTPVAQQFNTSLRLMAADGSLVAQADGPPANGLIPTTLIFDADVPDLKSLSLPADLAPGRYRLDLVVYDLATQTPVTEPLAVTWLLVGPGPTAAGQVEEARWRNGIALVGTDGVPTALTPGQALDLRLLWRADGIVEADYTAFVHLVGPDGVPVAQHDRAPEGGFYPTSAWSGGERVVDGYLVTVPDDLASGAYRLLAGWYRTDSGERALLDDGQDALILGEYSLVE